MKMLQTGDVCPICGHPILTEDPNKLIFLSAIGWYRELKEAGTDADVCSGPSSTGATNADKVRSLPDELLSQLADCPDSYDEKEHCGRDCRMNCVECTLTWLHRPFDGWEKEANR